MNWLTKELTLDLLAISIEGLVKIHDAIDHATQAERPVTPQDEVSAPAAEAPPATDNETDETAPAEPKTSPEAPAEADAPTLPEIQNALREISKNEDTKWIQDTLFPHFNINHLSQLPEEKFADAWDMITRHQEEKEAA